MTTDNQNESIYPLEGKNSDKANPEVVFTTTDPLGRMVQLKQTTWDGHIVGGDHNRVELVGQENVIRGIIEDPSYIVPDPSSASKQRYYDLRHLSTNNKIKPIMVVVDHSTSTGDVCTALVISRMTDTGERGITYVRNKS